mmetsp:Transcript_22110/g.30733  ORF Transcript_22110/g.30733 Transcript_22110/m.30733 type:complete len:273 (+) Transcript_22110:124-942(+)|eukprot:CAMPEP_0196592088 /NCGR_PEP_ID=MMETSP1081-20130531/71732_1 /TAXON_ID=36882 /ORGANISM="Pyramimonas amylifera, Strain CCMP720" /LENGTH=272 /DNA_ID=CAMNT_0041915667 /DNA_START=122 /DNA_END=940 /DNA_ORIENTATION=-
MASFCARSFSLQPFKTNTKINRRSAPPQILVNLRCSRSKCASRQHLGVFAASEHASLSDDANLSRRSALAISTFSAALLAVGVPMPGPARAESSKYTDPVDGFSLTVPEDWELGYGEAEGSQAMRRVVAFFPKDKAQSTNVTIVTTNLAADFTKLGSFGSAYEFGARLVGSLDRSAVGKKPKFMRGSGEGDGTGQVCKLVNTSEKNGMYNIEYTLSKKDEFDRHLFQVVGLAFTGVYNRLYTVTAQVNEEDLDSMKDVFSKVLTSFELPASK